MALLASGYSYSKAQEMKLSDLIGDYAHPAGEGGRDVPQEDAIKMANHMRWHLNFNFERDLNEEDVCRQVYWFDKILNREQDLYLAAWEHLNAFERRAWKECTQVGKNLHLKEEYHAHHR